MPPKKTTKKQDAERILELERELQMTRKANGKLFIDLYNYIDFAYVDNIELRGSEECRY